MALTELSEKLFRELAEDAPNWSGTPPFWGTKEERGNLTQLKRAKLVTTFDYDGDVWIDFTDAGKAHAAEIGVDLSWLTT